MARLNRICVLMSICADVLLETGHQHQVATVPEIAAQTVVENLAQHRARLLAAVAVPVDEQRQPLQGIGQRGGRERLAGGVGNLGSLLRLRLVRVLVVQVLVALLLRGARALLLAARFSSAAAAAAASAASFAASASASS